MKIELSKSGSTELTTILSDLTTQGNFPIAVLTDQQGFPIAYAAGTNQDPDTQAAVVALIQKTVTQATDQLGLNGTDEISLFDKAGQRLVCRPFSVNEDDMILAVLVSDKNQSYRRLTNNTLNAIRLQWEL